MSVPRTNLLLEALSPASRNRILSHAREVSLPIRTGLIRQNDIPKFAYFLTSGVASVVVFLPDGGSAEVTLIGREGVVGGLSLLGDSASPTQTFIQLDATGYRVPFEMLRAAFLDSEEIRTRILENVQQQGMTLSQIAACNKLHESEARLARWLLMFQDRAGEDVLQLTQEFLAEMLGAQRNSVALAAGALQKAGMIEYKRGKVTIQSREALEEAACDCYKVAQRLMNDLYKQRPEPGLLAGT